MWDIDGFLKIFKLMVNKGASDLHLRVPSSPVLRIDGALTTLEDLPAVNPQDVEILLEHITTLDQRSTFRKELELDIAYSIPG